MVILDMSEPASITGIEETILVVGVFATREPSLGKASLNRNECLVKPLGWGIVRGYFRVRGAQKIQQYQVLNRRKRSGVG